MSVLFLPPASAASVPDATETVSGKIRIATSAEATAGTLDSAAMTPLKVKSVVDAAVVGGVTYQGTFDTSSPVDLSNAEKGDLYIISVAGTYQGQTWAVGDHLLVNADMGGTISPSKLDKVDNTDSVSSVAGKVGAVTLVAGDVSGLAAVATSGAYSDLSGTPTLGTAAAEDVGTAASNVVQLDGSARLPAVDGSQLINIPAGAPASETVAGIIEISTDAEATAATATDKALVPSNLSSINVSTLNNDAGYLTDITGESVGDLSDVTVTTPSAGQGLIYNGTISGFENAAISVAALGDIGDVNLTSVQDYAVLKYDAGANEWFDASQVSYLFSSTTQSLTVKPGLSRVNLAGGSSSITVTLSISTLVAGQGVVLNVLNTGSVSSTLTIGATSWSIAPNQGGVWIATGLNTAYRVADSASAPSASETVEGIIEIATNAEATAATATDKAIVPSNLSSVNVSTLNNDAGYLTDITGESVGDLSDVTLASPSAGEALVYNGTLSVFENATVSASVAALNDIGDVDTTGVTSSALLQYDGANWVDGPLVGTSASNVVQLDGSARLPAVDGSQLTNLPSFVPTVTLSSPASSPLNLSAPSAGVVEEIYVLTPSLDLTVNLQSASSLGSGFKYQIKNRSTNKITIDASSAETIDGSFTFDLTAQESSVTLVTNGANWFII